MKGLPLVSAICVATLVAVPISDLDAADEQCGPEVVDDFADLQSAVDAFVNGGTCSLISLDSNITVNAPLNLFKVDVETPEIPEPISRSLTIDGDGFTLTGDSTSSGFLIFLDFPTGVNALTVRNLHMTGFGGSGALTVSSGATTIERSMFTKNSFMTESALLGTQDASAGAVNAFGQLSIMESQFEGNVGSNGGAVYSSPTLDLVPPRNGGLNSLIRVSGSSFFGNRANPGGSAVFSRQPLTMTKSTVTGNSGESLATLNVVGSALLDFCTIVDNTSTGSGGGISATLNITISNSIVFRNSPKDAYGYENITITSSLVTSRESVESTLIAATVDDSTIVGGDLWLSPLGNHGGFRLPGGTMIQTRPPQTGSSAIDKIESFAIGNSDEPTDQRGTGFSRFVNGRADMGAVEYRPAVVPDAPTDQPNPYPDYGGSLNIEWQIDLPDTM